MTSQYPPTNKRQSGDSGRWKKLLGAVLVTGSAIWIAYLLYASRDEFRANLLTLQPSWLLAAFALGLLGAATRGETFYLVIKNLAPGVLGRAQAFRLQYVAALARNLPGRFLGVAYQVAATRKQLPLSHLLLAQTLLAGIALFLAAVVAAAILIWTLSPAASVLILVLMLPLFAFGTMASTAFSKRLAKARPRGKLLNALVTLAKAQKNLGLHAAIHVLVVAVLGWTLYLAAWACIGQAHPDLDAYGGLRLAAFYTLAWLLGFIALITPSGLGVREASFLVLAAEFPSTILAMAAILGRLWFLLNDLVLGGVAMLITASEQPSKNL
jgi:hypothetical protein